MPRRDIEFKTTDQVILRGWFFTPNQKDHNVKLPCLVMSHGWSAVKEMDLDNFATYFTENLAITCLVYDHRGFGSSDCQIGAPRHEIVPSLQQSDYSDAITYAQSLPEVDPSAIGIWGTSYSGGHVLFVGAVDRRVKAVLSQMPMVDGWTNFHRLIRPDLIEGLNQGFIKDRLDRQQGAAAACLPVVDEDPMKPSALPTAESYRFFSAWETRSSWKNEVTLRSIELLRANDPSHMIHRISPTPLLMTVARNDTLVPTDTALESYSRAREPKTLNIIPGGHFDGYSDENFLSNITKQVEFLRATLCAANGKTRLLDRNV